MSIASVQVEGVNEQAIPEAGEAFVRGLRNGFLRRRRSPVPRMKVPTAEEMMAEAWRNVGDHLRGAMAEVDAEITRK
jgi:hypothetical protein